MITIITPVLNCSRFIEYCIKNVISQNCNYAEHIIIDGGSTDGTLEIIQKYAKESAHIKFISEKDSGQSEAMNKGLKLAKGVVIGFLNADDYYEPNTLNKVIDYIQNLPTPSMIVGNSNVWDNNKLLYISKPKNIGLFRLLYGYHPNVFPINCSQYFYHKSLHEYIGEFEINEHYAMDVQFILKALHKAKQVKYFNEC